MAKKENRETDKRSKKMKKLALILVSVACIVFFSVLLIYNYYVVENVITIDLSLKIGDGFGLNLSNDRLNFGTSPPGSLLKRKINITNHNDYPIFVTIKLKGDISPYFVVSNNNFKLEPDQKEVVTYYLHVPRENLQKGYSGQTWIYFKRFLIENYI